LLGFVNNIQTLFFSSRSQKSSAQEPKRKGKNRFTYFLLVASIISGFATYAAFAGIPPFGTNPKTVIWLLNIDLILVLILVSIIARRIVALWSGHRKGVAGSRLHVRLVYIFSILTVTPAIIMTIFAAFFLHFGVESWFSSQVRTAINESEAVAEAYLAEHQQVIRADTLAMASDLDRQAGFLIGNSEALEKVIETQSLIRNLAEAMVFDSSGRVLARSSLTFTLAFETVPDYLLERADIGEVVVMTRESDDRVRALVKLNNFNDAYLFVGRMVDPVVLSHVSDTRAAVAKYSSLEQERSDLQLKTLMIFIIAALLLLFVAIWLGLSFSRKLVSPVIDLIKAADRIRAGDLSVRVEEKEDRDEFSVLAKTFNKMTAQIQGQRNELIAANRQLDERRRFTETVLSGVSSGVLSINGAGIITLANSSASSLLQMNEETLIDKNISTILPDIVVNIETAFEKPDRTTQAEIPYIREDGHKRLLLVRITIDKESTKDDSEALKRAVITFDDITELHSAQRKAAWADVARRIAHEIKNPLTPIQLSAERLKRKYLKQITEDQDIFISCTDTIVQHVEDIGRMVNEFSDFARLPEPIMEEHDLAQYIKNMIVMQQQAHPHINISIESLGADIAAKIVCDARQIRQAITNIVQNAVDSLKSSATAEPAIDLKLFHDDEYGFVITAADNGDGFPPDEDISRLTEPYITHREKGTGLGLAIVKKIMDDHHGHLFLGKPDWINDHGDFFKNTNGAIVVLTLPYKKNSENHNDGTSNGDTDEGVIASKQAIA